jgi:hypothetical protein
MLVSANVMFKRGVQLRTRPTLRAPRQMSQQTIMVAIASVCLRLGDTAVRTAGATGRVHECTCCVPLTFHCCSKY